MLLPAYATEPGCAWAGPLTVLIGPIDGLCKELSVKNAAQSFTILRFLFSG